MRLKLLNTYIAVSFHRLFKFKLYHNPYKLDIVLTLPFVRVFIWKEQGGGE